MKNPFAKRLKEASATEQAAKIALALTHPDPYAHHWCRQSNYIIVCEKCGTTHLDKVSDGRVFSKCWMHDNHPRQAN